MPRTKAKLNRSAAIRQALAQHPDKGPTEIARLLTLQLGVPIRPNDVSKIKARLRQKPQQAAQPRPAPAVAQQTAAPSEAAPQTVAPSPAVAQPTVAPPLPAPVVPAASPAEGVVEVVATLQGYIERLGKADLHRLIDML